MKYTVVWTPMAESELARIWLDATDRDAITSAAAALDRLLSRDPEFRGEVSFDTVRTLSVPPLGVDFEVIEPDRIVCVLIVWSSLSGSEP
jgi:hypothetical protein